MYQRLNVVLLVFATCITSITCWPNEKVHRYHKGSFIQTITNLRCVTNCQNHICLGLQLAYKNITLLDNLPGLTNTTYDTHPYLERYRKKIKLVDPICWTYMEPALCLATMRPCEENYDNLNNPTGIRISIPNDRICMDAVNNCEYTIKKGAWPSILNCTDHRLFHRNGFEAREFLHYLDRDLLICPYPLVASNDNFRGIRNCSLSCKFPVSDKKHQEQITSFIKFMSWLVFWISIAAVAMFYINRKKNQYPMARVMVTCSIMVIISTSGWLLQWFIDDIGCAQGGAKLTRIPIRANACFFSFTMTYIGELSTSLLIAYYAQISYNEILDEKNHKLSKQNGIFQEINWNCIWIVTISSFILVSCFGDIDGHGLYGICTVGQSSLLIKIILSILPKTIAIIYTIITTVLFLTSTKEGLWRWILLTLFNSLGIVPIWTIYNEQANKDSWSNEIETFLTCFHIESWDQVSNNCAIRAAPSMIPYYLELLHLFGVGFSVCLWAFSESNCRVIFSRNLCDKIFSHHVENMDMNLTRNQREQCSESRNSSPDEQEPFQRSRSMRSGTTSLRSTRLADFVSHDGTEISINDYPPPTHEQELELMKKRFIQFKSDLQLYKDAHPGEVTQEHPFTMGICA